MDFPPPRKERVRRKKEKIRREREQRVAKNIFYMANGGPIEGEKEGRKSMEEERREQISKVTY